MVKAIEFNNVHIEPKEYSPKDKYPPSLELNHPSVQKVIQIALELTRENRIITTELLYNLAKKQLQIPKLGLDKIIHKLLKKKILVDGSKFTKITILEHNTRHYIYQLIKKHIGAHFSFLKEMISVQKECEIGVGQLIWHLEKLLEFNFIKKVKVKNYVLFLPIEVDNNLGILNFILRDEINRKIVDLIIKQGIINKSDICNQLELNREVLYYHIKNLIQFDILSPVKEDKNHSLVINPNKKDLINKVMSNSSIP